MPTPRGADNTRRSRRRRTARSTSRAASPARSSRRRARRRRRRASASSAWSSRGACSVVTDVWTTYRATPHHQERDQRSGQLLATTVCRVNGRAARTTKVTDRMPRRIRIWKSAGTTASSFRPIHHARARTARSTKLRPRGRGASSIRISPRHNSAQLTAVFFSREVDQAAAVPALSALRRLRDRDGAAARGARPDAPPRDPYEGRYVVCVAGSS